MAESMERGYSKILLQEIVVDDRNPNPLTTALDLTMMMAYSPSERTSATWGRILSLAGLKMIKIWTPPAGTESIIEAELES